METYLIFHEGVELPCFASFDLMKSDAGVAQVRRYYERYAAMARERGLGFVLESRPGAPTATGRAKLGYDRAALAEINRRTIALMAQMRDRIRDAAQSPIVISGNIGPRGDGYSPDRMMSADGGAGLSRRADRRVRRAPRPTSSARSRSTMSTRRSAWRAPRKPPACRR